LSYKTGDPCRRRKDFSSHPTLNNSVYRGDVYFYYICRGRQNHTCDLPYMPVADVEEAVADHYTTVRLPADLHERIHRGVDAALSATATTSAELIDGIRQQITRLDAQEDQYLDLVGDPDWPRDKIAEHLRKIRDERARLEHKISQGERPDLDAGANALRAVLELLERPDQLYRLASDRARRVLNQAIFTRLYVDAEDRFTRVHDDEPTEPFAPLIAVHRAEQRESGGAAHLSNTAADGGNRTTALLATALTGGCSSKAAWVEVAGIEPASFSTKTGLLRAQPA